MTQMQKDIIRLYLQLDAKDEKEFLMWLFSLSK
jgi:hypothetical protein